MSRNRGSLESSLLGRSATEFQVYRAHRLGIPTLGMDTEFWGEVKVRDKHNLPEWKVVPGFAFLPWDKGNYMPLSQLAYLNKFIGGDATKIGNDGLLAEIAPESNTCRQILLTNITQAILAVAWKLREYVIHNLGNSSPKYGIDYRLAVTPITRDFDLDWLQTLPEKYRVLGCAPSLNAFGDEFRRAPEEFCDEVSERTLGTHVHIGALNFTDYLGRRTPLALALHEFPDVTISLLELFVNLPLTWYWSNHGEELAARRKTYGEAGCYRKTPYGIEWRSLPALAVSSPWLYHTIYGMVRNVIYFAASLLYHEDFELLERIWDKAKTDNIQEIINTSNGAAAKEFVIRHEMDFWKVHHYVGKSSAVSITDGWEIFKFMSDNPNLRRSNDFNSAWQMPLLLRAAEKAMGELEKNREVRVNYSYYFWGALSETAVAKDVFLDVGEDVEKLPDFINEKGGFLHTKCGKFVPLELYRVLQLTSWKLDSAHGLGKHHHKWTAIYCPQCDAATPKTEWKGATWIRESSNSYNITELPEGVALNERM